MTISNEPKLQNIFQDILSEAQEYYEKSSRESNKINKKSTIFS